jgi:hypothetical protein
MIQNIILAYKIISNLWMSAETKAKPLKLKKPSK